MDHPICNFAPTGGHREKGFQTADVAEAWEDVMCDRRLLQLVNLQDTTSTRSNAELSLFLKRFTIYWRGERKQTQKQEAQEFDAGDLFLLLSLLHIPACGWHLKLWHRLLKNQFGCLGIQNPAQPKWPFWRRAVWNSKACYVTFALYCGPSLLATLSSSLAPERFCQAHLCSCRNNWPTLKLEGLICKVLTWQKWYQQQLSDQLFFSVGQAIFPSSSGLPQEPLLPPYLLNHLGSTLQIIFLCHFPSPHFPLVCQPHVDMN